MHSKVGNQFVQISLQNSELVKIEKELEKKELKRNNGERNVYIFFPQNQY